MAPTLDQDLSRELAHDELAGRLAEHTLAGALVRKSVTDPVPFAVWWRVSDALRAAVLGPAREAVETVETAMTALAEATGDRAGGAAATWPSDDPARSLRNAQLLVARLVFATTPTSPTLLQVRLARLRRALLAAA